MMFRWFSSNFLTTIHLVSFIPGKKILENYDAKIGGKYMIVGSIIKNVTQGSASF